MKLFITIFLLVLNLFLGMAFVQSASALESVLRISDRQVIDLGRMLAESASVRYFFVAENHDDPQHHSYQLTIIKELKQQGRRLAIGLEMFPITSQDKLD